MGRWSKEGLTQRYSVFGEVQMIALVVLDMGVVVYPR